MQLAFDQAKHFLAIAQDLERNGEVAHSDVIKFQLQYNQQDQLLSEARLALQTARLNVAVLLFPDLNRNFTVEDDLEQASPLPASPEAHQMAATNKPQLRAAMESLRRASKDVELARCALLPSLSFDADDGIEANALAMRRRLNAFREAGCLPNLGFFVTATISFPVWDWGSLRSKLHQADCRREQAQASYDTSIQSGIPEEVVKVQADAEAARENLAAAKQLYDSVKKLFAQGALAGKDLD